jgi:hypothetical protein
LPPALDKEEARIEAGQATTWQSPQGSDSRDSDDDEEREALFGNKMT